MITLSEQEPIITIKQFLGTYIEPDRPQAGRAAKFFEDSELLPLLYTTNGFEDINQLAAWLNWCGFIAIHKSGTEYKGKIYAPKEEHPYLEEIAGRHKLTLKPNDNDNNLTLSENGAWYARLFSFLVSNVSEGSIDYRDKKSHHDLEIPQYIRFLVQNHEHMGGNDQSLSGRLLKDYISILFKNKLHRTRGYRCIRPNLQRSEDSAHRLAEQIVQLINSVYPLIGINTNSIRIDPWQNGEGYQAAIVISKDDVRNAANHYNLSLT